MEVKPKYKNLADDILDSVGSITPNKRSRSSLAGGGPNGTPKMSTPTSAGRPAGAGPSRLFSSPTMPATSSPLGPPATPLVPFDSRSDKLKLQESLNGHLPLPTFDESKGTTTRIQLASSMDPKKYQYRYQFERLMERSEVLDTTIDEAAEAISQYYSITELSDPSVQTQEDVIVVGRLCPEVDGVKMTETATWLETSRSLGSGTRIRLAFEPDMAVQGGPVGGGGVGFFPGCLVGLLGRNGGGKLFSVKRVFMMPPGDAAYTRPSELLDYQYGEGAKRLAGAPMSVFVAAGPYTIESDLQYAPLDALVKQAQKEKPDVLLMLGPFVDADHPLVKAGDIDDMPAEIFRKQFSVRLAELTRSSPRTTVLLVPNGRDLVSNHIAYPQSPLSKDPELQLPKAVKCLPNPTTFSINEVLFSASSLDVLFHLRNQEFFKKCAEIVPIDPSNPDQREPEDPNAKDMMARTCRHLLRHRSFYPIFPAPLPSKGIDSLNLDITHNDLVKMGYTSADIVILPSLLKHFVKVVDSTIMINPSFLTRGNSAGTFGRLTIHPMPQRTLQALAAGGASPDAPLEHGVFERCRVDIVKI